MPGIQEWLVIAFVALVVLGPERLPVVARKAGELVTRFRSETRRNVEELRRMAEIEELEREVQGLRQELRGTREDVDRSLSARPGDRGRGPAAPGGGRAGSQGGGRAGSQGGGRGGSQGGAGRAGRFVRADDDPPPIDPEAT